MNTDSIYRRAAMASQARHQFDGTEGRPIHVISRRPSPGLPRFYRDVTGVVESIDLSFFVVRRTDIPQESNSNYEQRVTFTWSDFLTGRYTYTFLDQAT